MQKTNDSDISSYRTNKKKLTASTLLLQLLKTFVWWHNNQRSL